MSRHLNEYAKYGTIGISWVLVTGIYIYIGYRSGLWLDARWDTEPIFMAAGIVLGMVLSLVTLVKELLALEGLLGRAGSSRATSGRVRESNNFPDKLGPTPKLRAEKGSDPAPATDRPLDPADPPGHHARGDTNGHEPPGKGGPRDGKG